MLYSSVCRSALQFGEFTLANGDKSNYYFDMKQVYMQTYLMSLVVKMFRSMLDPLKLEFQLVGGPAVGAVPLACALAMSYYGDDMWPDMFYFDPRSLGAKRKLQGNICAGDQVVIVEDTVNGGDSTIATAKAVQAAGAHVVACLALLDRRNGSTTPLLKEAGVPCFLPVFQGSEFDADIQRGIKEYLHGKNQAISA